MCVRDIYPGVGKTKNQADRTSGGHTAINVVLGGVIETTEGSGKGERGNRSVCRGKKRIEYEGRGD